MVAYGFRPAFCDPIVAGTKRQTIRAHRKRHARPGERLQLFVGLRTKACRKIIPDPVCLGLDEVVFDLSRASREAARFPESISIEVNGIPLIGAAADNYACGDGFGGLKVSPFLLMGRFWLRTHGRTRFEGVAIRWENAP